MDIVFNEVEHKYQVGTPFERLALYDINLHVPKGTFLGVIGHTGSGKSTLMQHINALLKPTSGLLTVGETQIKPKEKLKDVRELRKKVGIVFQYPEYQLFEETVEKDICFAPLNFGISLEEAKEKAREAIKLVGLSEELLTSSPFNLSGGQMRRVAIAGVIVMKPEIIILDEPTAGLDPKGRKEIMNLFAALHKELNMTTIFVTHSMEDAALYSDQIVVMHKGTIKMQGTPKEIFQHPKVIQEVGLEVPESVKLMMKIEEKFNLSVPYDVFSPEGVADIIAELVKKGERL